MFTQPLLFRLGMTWPAYYPEECPPDDAADPDGEFYRFVKCDPPGAIDFLSNRELHPGMTYSDSAVECRSCALSMIRDLSDVISMQQMVPGFRKRSVAIGTLQSEDGRIAHTPSQRCPSHHSWWIPETISEPWRLFRVVIL